MFSENVDSVTFRLPRGRKKKEPRSIGGRRWRLVRWLGGDRRLVEIRSRRGRWPSPVRSGDMDGRCRYAGGVLGTIGWNAVVESTAE